MIDFNEFLKQANWAIPEVLFASGLSYRVLRRNAFRTDSDRQNFLFCVLGFQFLGLMNRESSDISLSHEIGLAGIIALLLGLAWQFRFPRIEDLQSPEAFISTSL